MTVVQGLDDAAGWASRTSPADLVATGDSLTAQHLRAYLERA